MNAISTIFILISWYSDIIMTYGNIKPHHTWSHPGKHLILYISVSIFWYYHDILILSWYIKISSFSTLSHIQANIRYYDIGINILILSWYSDIITISQKMSSPSTLSHITANIWYYDIDIDILILSWYPDISKEKWAIEILHNVSMSSWHHYEIKSKVEALVHTLKKV